MVKFLLLFICALTFATDLKAQQPVYNRQFVYDQRVLDMDAIRRKEGEIQHIFILTNKETKPVCLLAARTWQHRIVANSTRQ